MSIQAILLNPAYLANNNEYKITFSGSFQSLKANAVVLGHIFQSKISGFIISAQNAHSAPMTRFPSLAFEGLNK